MHTRTLIKFAVDKWIIYLIAADFDSGEKKQTRENFYSYIIFLDIFL